MASESFMAASKAYERIAFNFPVDEFRKAGYLMLASGASDKAGDRERAKRMHEDAIALLLADSVRSMKTVTKNADLLSKLSRNVDSDGGSRKKDAKLVSRAAEGLLEILGELERE
jgi:hypothetical protein